MNPLGWLFFVKGLIDLAMQTLELIEGDKATELKNQLAQAQQTIKDIEVA